MQIDRINRERIKNLKEELEGTWEPKTGTVYPALKSLAKKGYISIDVEMVQYLGEQLGEYPLVAANKIDKGNDPEIMENLEAFIMSLTEGEPEKAIGYIYPVSAKKGVGVGELKNQLVSRLYRKGFKDPFEYRR